MALNFSCIIANIFYFFVLSTSLPDGYFQPEILEVIEKLNIAKYLGDYRAEDFQITHPVHLDHSGNILSYKTLFHENDVDNDVFYSIKAFGKEFNLNLKKNKDTIDPDLEYTERNDDGTVTKLHTKNFHNCLYHGKVNSDEYSIAAFSLCDGLTGVIRIDGQSYAIQEVPHSLQKKFTDDSGRKSTHLIYKIKPNKSAFCEETTLNINYYNGRDDNAANANKLTIETAVFVDYALYKYLKEKHQENTDDEILKYVYTMMNTIEIMYNEPSMINIPIKFVLIKVEVFKTDQALYKFSDIGEKFIINFCTWQSTINPGNGDDTDDKHWDHTFLFTGIDIKSSDGSSDAIGVAPVGGMCNPHYSCTITESQNFLGSFTATHECGHSFGMHHDGSGNSCDKNKYIMASVASEGQATWSTCSVDYMKEFLKKPQTVCLLDARDKSDYNFEGDLPGQRFPADAQCQMIGDESATHDTSQPSAEVCNLLKCTGVAGVHPALEGTFCGDNSWCLNGNCTPWGDHGPNSVNGGWSEWSEYTSCNSSCFENAVGIQFSSRRCNQPSPNNGGKRCDGVEKRFRICSTKDTCQKPNSIESFGTKACASPPENLMGVEDLTGKSKQVFKDKTGGCVVWCQRGDPNKWTSWNPSFPDGTLCSKKISDRKYCLTGKCFDFGKGDILEINDDGSFNSADYTN